MLHTFLDLALAILLCGTCKNLAYLRKLHPVRTSGHFLACLRQVSPPQVFDHMSAWYPMTRLAYQRLFKIRESLFTATLRSIRV